VVVADLPAKSLTDEAPVYDQPTREPAHLLKAREWTIESIPELASDGVEGALLGLLKHPTIASKRWVWKQYDHMVMADTMQIPGGDAGVVRIHGTNRGLAITTDCTPRYVYADPYEGGKQAIAEAYRNLCAVGARPLAVTNCLNFANPQRPEIMSQFVHALEGMGDACRALDFPIVSGNVSLYNETDGEDINTLHKGISYRKFNRKYDLADDIVVKDAKLENGLLTIHLERIIPEEKKPRVIEIK